MKKLLLGLLLLSGLAIQAEEPAVQPEVPKEAEKDFKKIVTEINRADLEYLVNCIRSNEVPDKRKDRECYFDTVANAIGRDYNERVDANDLKEKFDRFFDRFNESRN